MVRKVLPVLAVFIAVSVLLTPMVFAAGINPEEYKPDWEKANSSDESTFTEAASNLGDSIVMIVRSIAIILAVVMAVILALKLFGGGVQAAAEAKTSIVLLIVALFVAFNAETIVGVIIKAVRLQ